MCDWVSKQPGEDNLRKIGVLVREAGEAVQKPGKEWDKMKQKYRSQTDTTQNENNELSSRFGQSESCMKDILHILKKYEIS